MIFVAGLAFLAASCAKEIATDESEQISGNVTESEITFNVCSEDVKAVISDKTIEWELTDKIAVYDGTAINTFTCTDADGAKATFTGTAAEAEKYTVVYPYNAASIKENKVQVVIPADQCIKKGYNLDTDAILAVACAEKNGAIAFSNAFSLVKFEIVEEGVTMVSFRGNNKEKIAGAGTIDPETLAITLTDASEVVNVVYDNGDEFPVGAYYAAIHPATFTKGFRMVLSNDEGWKAPKGTAANMVFARNAGVNLGQLTDLVWIPAEITTAAQLKAWGYISDLYLADETVKLGADIDYNGAEWTPAKNFKGIFDGQNHKVYNIKVTAKQVRSGFIDQLVGGTVKNVCFGSSDYDFTKGASADAGTYDGASVITSCFDETPTEWTYVAPIAYTAEGSTVSNVVNFIPVTATDAVNAQLRLGGITGILKGKCKIENCVNFGNVSNEAAGCTTDNTKSSTAGICAWTDGDGNEITGCVNHGDITNKDPKAVRTGGVVGTTNGTAVITGCTNNGHISNAVAASANAYIGGILANNDVTGTTIEKCVNNGNVTADKKMSKSLHVGGICGYAQLATVIKGCTNSKNCYIRTTTDCGSHLYIGGICGAISKSTITKSDDGTHTTNAASIAQNVNFSGNPIIGGIAGYCADVSTFSYCDNSGEVSTGKKFANETAVTIGIGGICGYNKNGSDFTFCTNSGIVTAHAAGNAQVMYVAGILGGKTAPRTMTNCSNSATITLQKGAKKSYVGGLCTIIDTPTTTFADCTDSGQILVNRAAQMYAGCLAARLNVNTTASEKTVCAGCAVNAPADKQIILATTEALANNTGLLFGVLSGTSASKTNVGPVTFGAGMEIWLKADAGNSKIADITSDNVSDYIVGKNVAADEKVVYNYTVSQ